PRPTVRPTRGRRSARLRSLPRPGIADHVERLLQRIPVDASDLLDVGAAAAPGGREVIRRGLPQRVRDGKARRTRRSGPDRLAVDGHELRELPKPEAHAETDRGPGAERRAEAAQRVPV